jgi:hypothetical protein
MRTLSGLATARGLVSGPVFVYRDGGEIPIPEYKVPPGMEQSEIVRLSAHILIRSVILKI